MGDIRPDTKPVKRGSAPDDLPKADLVPYAQTLTDAVNRPEDLALIERIALEGIPVVTVLLSGRPLLADAEIDASAAFVAA